jgi:hypothetical protein
MQLWEFAFMKKLLGMLALGLTPMLSFAAGPDLTALTTAVDFGTVTTAILAVGALIVVPYLAFKGVKIVVRAVKGA